MSNEGRTYVSRDGVEVVGNSGHVASDITSTVVNARILETAECHFYESAGAKWHVPSIFCGDTKFEKIKLVDVFQKSAGVREHLACCVAPDTSQPARVNSAYTVET